MWPYVKRWLWETTLIVLGISILVWQNGTRFARLLNFKQCGANKGKRGWKLLSNANYLTIRGTFIMQRNILISWWCEKFFKCSNSAMSWRRLSKSLPMKLWFVTRINMKNIQTWCTGYKYVVKGLKLMIHIFKGKKIDDWTGKAGCVKDHFWHQLAELYSFHLGRQESDRC